MRSIISNRHVTSAATLGRVKTQAFRTGRGLKLFAIICALALIAPNPVRAQQPARDAALRSLTTAYTQAAQKVAKAAEDNVSSEKYQAAIKELLDLDDKVQAGLDGATPSLRQAALWEIARTRMNLDYRDPVPIAERGIVGEDAIAGRLALAIGDFGKAIRILSQSHDPRAGDLLKKAAFAQSVISSDSPKAKCDRNNDICQMLYSLLGTAPISRAGMYEDFLGHYKARRAPPSEDPNEANQHSFIEFLLSGNTPKIAWKIAQSVSQWKSKMLTTDAAERFKRALAAPDDSRSGLKIIEFLIQDSTTAAILATDLMREKDGKPYKPKMLPGAAVKPGSGNSDSPDSDDFLTVTLEDRFSIGPRQFVVVKVEGGIIETNIAIFEAPQETPSKLWYWIGGTGGGGIVSSRGSLSTAKDLVLVTRSETTSKWLTLWILDAAHRRVTQLFNTSKDPNFAEADHGMVFFPDMDGSGLRKVFVSWGVLERRYSDCNQCPSRRASVIFDFIPETGSLNALGNYSSWNDVGFGANDNLFGLGPEVTRSGLLATVDLAAASLGKLSANDAEHLVSAGRQGLSAAAALEESQSHDEAAAAALRILAILKGKGEFPGAKEQKLLASVVIAKAYVSLGHLQDAARVLEGYDQTATADESLRRAYMELRYQLARDSGGVDSEFDTLQDIRKAFPDEPWGDALFADYLLDVGDLDQALLTARAVSDRRMLKLQGWTRDLLAVATALSRSGKFQSALDELAILLRYEAEDPDSALTAKALVTAGDIAIKTGNFDVAKNLLESSIAQMNAEAWSEQGGAVLTLYGRLLRKVGDHNRSQRILAVALRLLGARKDAIAASATDEMASTLDEMGQHEEALAASNAAFKMLLSEQTQVSQEPYKLSFVSSAAEIANRHIVRLLDQPKVSPDALIDALEQWRAQVLRSLRRDQASVLTMVASPSAAVAKFATGRNAYVTYYVRDNKTVAVICEDGRCRIKQLAISAPEIERHRKVVKKFTNLSDDAAVASVFADSLPRELNTSLTTLYAGLIAGLDLAPASKVVYIVPDEALYWVPWAALNSSGKSGTAGDRLRSPFEDYAILVAPSALLPLDEGPLGADAHSVSIGSSEAIPTPAIKVALPDMYVVREPWPLPALGSAQLEAVAVAKVLGKTMPVRLIAIPDPADSASPPASAATVVEAISGATVVHIAAHGIFDAYNPMASAIFLSPDVTGVLRPSDLRGADLSRTSLVSLSACETGANDVKAGGEAIGFVRGILLAGAHRVLLTQWKVEDRSAREFFESFYAEVAKSQDYAEAYRRAVLQSAQHYSNPFYWGGFAMYSNVPR